ncbi:hypothetical protein G9A89_021059 [Geosiphon pyriformis]|nr:hypothetical protein G9A89_021059 [Geosiphon pyriformis]
MARETNLSIDTAAAARGIQKSLSKTAFDGDVIEELETEEDELSPSPDVPDEDIDFNLVYAFHTFGASVEGQASVEKGEALKLLDDGNSYWWLVEVLKDKKVGYIPAENIETPYERLARLNKHRNVNLSSSINNGDLPPEGLKTKKNDGPLKTVNFTSPVFFVEMSEEEDFEEEFPVEADEQNNQNEEETGENQVINELAPYTIIDNSERIQEEKSIKTDDPRRSEESRRSMEAQASEDQLREDEFVETQSFEEPQQDHAEGQSIKENLNNSIGIESNNSSNLPTQSSQPVNKNQQYVGGPVIVGPEADPFKSKSNETKKITITPSLRSDFIDMSDEDDDWESPKASKFSSLGVKEGKKRVSLEDHNKYLPSEAVEDKKGKKKEKTQGRFKKFFSIKKGKSKKEESKSAGSINVSTNVKTSHTGSNEPQAQTQQYSSKNSVQPNTQPSPQGISGQIHPQQPAPQPSPIKIESNAQINTPISAQQTSERLDSPSREDLHKTSDHQQNLHPLNTTSHIPNTETHTTSFAHAESLLPLISVVRIFAGQNFQTSIESKIILLSNSTTSRDLIRQSLTRFKLGVQEHWDDYYISIKTSEGETINLMPHDHPLDIFNSLNSSATIPLPTIRRNSVSSISSNLSSISNHTAIKESGINEHTERNEVRFFLNRKTSRRGSRTFGEKRLRVHVLVYADDLPLHLRKGISVPRTSMSVPKHLADKAARRRSPGEEGKPKAKVLLIDGRATVGDVIEKALDKFGIANGIVDNGEVISENDDERLRYHLMMIVEGEEKHLDPLTQLIAVYPSPPNFQHLSIDSLESANSLGPDYHLEEPMFVLRLSNLDDHQRYPLPKIDTQTNPQQNVEETYEINNQPLDQIESSEEKALSRKKLIEQQREYIRAKQRSILSAHKNAEKGVDIITSVGSIRSSRIFGTKVRYSFIPKQGEEIDISDIIEDIWGDDLTEGNTESMQPIPMLNIIPAEVYDDEANTLDMAPLMTSKKEKRLSTRDTDILEVIVDNAGTNNETVNQAMDDRIGRVLRKVKAGQFGGNGAVQSITSALRNQLELTSAASSPIPQLLDDEQEKDSQVNNDLPNNTLNPTPISHLGAIEPLFNQNEIDSNLGSSPSKPNSLKMMNLNSQTQRSTSPNFETKNITNRNRSPSITSTNSSNTINIPNSLPTSTQPIFTPGSASSATSSTENDWVFSDDFGLQELLILVRSGVSMLEQKERRRSGWRMYDDPEKVLEQINPAEFRDEIKFVFANVNKELNDLETELDFIMDDVVRVF